MSNSETIYRPATHTYLDPGVEPGLEAMVGAPVRHWIITVEDIDGRVVIVTPEGQAPNVSYVLARSSVDRLS